MPLPEDSREANDLDQTLRQQSTQEGEFDLDRTMDADLYATIKNGTATVAQIKVLIPGFEILEELGRGAFGVVYRARDEKLDRHVAIKVSLLDDPSRREQYVKEARNAAKLDSPGIVPVFQVGTLDRGQPFVVQRLIEGSTLRKMLAESGTLDVRQACWLMTQIAGAVAQAHAVGMIHRDLKPDNILVDAQGNPWVADFGLALLEEEQNQHHGERAGTPLYMSPEQLRGHAQWLDGRTDIYAMGIMFYEMLVGRPPFDARNLAELEEQVLHRDPKPMSQRSQSIPASLDVVFQNCCAKQACDRYANAYEFVADLEAVMAELPATVSQVPIPNRPYSKFESGTRVASPLPISVRRKTLRQSSLLETTLHVPEARRSFSGYRIPAILLSAIAIVGLVAYAFWPTSDTPDQLSARDTTLPSVIAAIPLPAENNSLPEASTAEATTAATLDPQVAPVPRRPLRVSKGSDGTHSTIREALAAAHDGETITILPGNYVESLVLTQSLRLVGEGSSDQIVIVGENENAISIRGNDNIAVEFSHLSVEGIATADQDFNTIEIHDGVLVLDNCAVNSRSYDCVKVHPGSGLTAQRSSFRSTAHPAISAENAGQLEIVDCSFEIRPPTLESSSIPVGLQATGCAGSVRGCRFIGSGSAVGIHWQDTSEKIVIENTLFENCDQALILQNCQQLQLHGTERSQFIGCRSGLLLQGCTGRIEGVDINTSSGRYGVRILDDGDVSQVKVTLANCNISGYQYSLSVEHANVEVTQLSSQDHTTAGIQVVAQSQLTLQNSNISHSDGTGILVEDATAVLTDCVLEDHDYAGLSVDTWRDTLVVSRCEFRNNRIGLLVLSGSVKLQNSLLQSKMVGVLVASAEELGQTKPARPPIIALEIGDVRFADNADGDLLVRTACRLRPLPSASGGKLLRLKPRIVGHLETVQEGDVTVVRDQTTPQDQT